MRTWIKRHWWLTVACCLIASSAAAAVLYDANGVAWVLTNATNLTQTTTNNVLLVAPYSTWNAQHTPGLATKATISKASGGGTVRHVITAFTACISVTGTAQTPVQLQVRDGATGAGTIIWSATFSAAANGSGTCVSQNNLSLVGSQATAATIEFSAAGVTSSQQTVSMQGYSIP